MAKLQIDLSGRGGLAVRHWGDMDRTVSTPELRYIGGEGQVAEGMYNPFRRYGYLSPSNAVFANIGGTDFNNVTSASVHDIENIDFYMSVRGEEILKGSALGVSVVSTPHDLGSTGTPVIMDLEIYQLNGARRLFYCYEKAGNAEIGEGILPLASENDDWLTADVSGSFTNTLINDVFMRIADNGFAYIFMDNQVHKLDGTTTGGSTGTVSANVLLFPPFFQIVDAVDYQGKIYMAIHQSTTGIRGTESEDVYNTPVGVYIWDRLSSIVRMRDYIPLNNVKQIRNIYVSPEGELRLMCVNSERITEIRQFNGSTFKTIEEIGLSAYPRFIDSLTVVSGFTIWLGVNGNIYAHGKLNFKEKEALYLIGNLPETSLNTGAIFFGGDNTYSTTTGFKETRNGIYLGYRKSDLSFVLKNWDFYGTGADNVSSTQEKGDVYTLVKYLPQMSTINYIDIYMYPGAGSGSTTAGTLKVYFNQSSTAWASKVVTRDESANGYKRIEINKPYVNSIQLEIEFSTSTGVGTFDFAPSFAIVNYESTTTKG